MQQYKQDWMVEDHDKRWIRFDGKNNGPGEDPFLESSE